MCYNRRTAALAGLLLVLVALPARGCRNCNRIKGEIDYTSSARRVPFKKDIFMSRGWGAAGRTPFTSQGDKADSAREMRVMEIWNSDSDDSGEHIDMQRIPFVQFLRSPHNYYQAKSTTNGHRIPGIVPQLFVSSGWGPLGAGTLTYGLRLHDGNCGIICVTFSTLCSPQSGSPGVSRPSSKNPGIVGARRQDFDSTWSDASHGISLQRMMFVEDLAEDFLNHISGEHILLFVSYDVDAVCACRILQTLFRSESTLYTLVPVEGTQELHEAYRRFSDKVKFVVFINCGGTIDLVETLEPDPDVLLFVIDSHKPTDICNVYSRSQVRLIGKPDEAENIPQFEDIFLDTDTEEESDGEEVVTEETLRKRRERKQWEEKRNRVMFDYTQFNFYGRSSALVVFEMTWSLGKDDLECLWWAIVGLTYQTVMGLIIDQKYACELQVLQLHLSRLTSIGQNDTEANRAQFYRITSQKDLRLVLYRHWNVQASLRHTICTAVKLKLWTVRSERKLYQVLAEIGLPLKDSLQNFSSMDVTLRNEFFSMAETVANNYDIDELIYQSFSVSVCYGNNFFQASDYVYAMICLLEDVTKDRSRGSCFSDCIDSLSPHKYQLIIRGIEKCKKLFTSIIRLVQSMLDMKQIISAGPFLYLIINENTSDYSLYGHPMSLTLLARYALNACTTASNYRRHGSLPLIVSAPQADENCLVLGIPPVTEYVPRNFFGKAFDQALETINVQPVLTYFDSAAVRISVKDRPKFFDSLATILS